MNATPSPSPSFSIRAHVARLPAGSQREQCERALAHLEAMLHTYSFTLRDDSRLAFLWATGRLAPTWTDQEVAHEMMCQQWICSNTTYMPMSQTFLRALADGLRTKYELRSWTTTWRIVREYGPDILRAVCLTDVGGQFPPLIPNGVHLAPPQLPVPAACVPATGHVVGPDGVPMDAAAH